MAGAIPTETINDILDRVDIVELISSYIPLKRAGRNLRTECPFHHEKTASFIVSPDKQIYHCFGCGAGGNAISFLMQYDHISFVEAMEILAKRSGIELEHLTQHVSKEKSSRKEKLYTINELAALFYHKYLLNSDAASGPRSYLQKRGVTKEVAQNMRLGFAPDKWDSLLAYLKDKGINPGFISQLGLAIEKDKGGFYDRFRNRIIFPICNVKSQVIGFGARVLDNSTPKYVNSPETPLYIKGKHLYGLNFSKAEIRKNDLCLIVEGYLDFLTPYSSGITNIAASLGTALTRDQIRLIKRYTHNVVMIYDSDLSGELATLRSLDLFIEEGLNVKVVSLDKGYDPDLFIRKFGPEALMDKVKTAKTLFDYKLDFLRSHDDSDSIEKKAKIIDEMLQTINKFNNAVIKSSYIRRLAEELNVSEDAIRGEASKIAGSATKDKRSINTATVLKKNTRAFERLLVQLMLQEENLVHKIKDSVFPSDFKDEHLSKIVAAMFKLVQVNHTISPSKLLHCFPENPEISSVVCELSAIEENLQDGDQDRDKVVNDCISRIKNESKKVERQKLSSAIKQAQEVKDEERLLSLLYEFNNLTKRKAI